MSNGELEEKIKNMSDEELSKMVSEAATANDRDRIRAITACCNPRQLYMVVLPAGAKARPDVAGKLKGVNATVVFEITGEGGGAWSMLLKDGDIDMKEGSTEGANATITMDYNIWKSISKRELEPQMAFMSGKIKFKGDMGLLMKIGTVLRPA